MPIDTAPNEPCRRPPIQRPRRGPERIIDSRGAPRQAKRPNARAGSARGATALSALVFAAAAAAATLAGGCAGRTASTPASSSAPLAASSGERSAAGESTVVPPPLATAEAMDTAAARSEALAAATSPAPPTSAAPEAPVALGPTAPAVPAPTIASPAGGTPGTGVGGAPPPDPAAPPIDLAAPPTAGAGAASVMLPGLVHTWQKWNNCGPSAAVMALSAFGLRIDQLAAAAELKPDREDTNVAPDELAAFARRQGVRALVRFGADRDRLRALLRAGVPVIVEHWISVEHRGEMGHYRVLVGFDDATGAFIAFDSYYGANRRYGYDEVDRMGRPFLGAYLPIYRPDQAGAVDAALAGDASDEAMWARVDAQVEAYGAAHADDPWGWFALGEARARRHDAAGAVAAFDRARSIGLPFRAFWYQFGYAQALFETGAYEALVAQADATLESMHGENLEEWHVWRGRALHALGRDAEARAAYEHALAFHAGFPPAVAALAELP